MLMGNPVSSIRVTSIIVNVFTLDTLKYRFGSTTYQNDGEITTFELIIFQFYHVCLSMTEVIIQVINPKRNGTD